MAVRVDVDIADRTVDVGTELERQLVIHQDDELSPLGDGEPAVLGEGAAGAAVVRLRAGACSLELEERPFGAAAIRATGTSLPDETLAACRAADAVLKAPIGDPEFDAADVRPEQGMLRLRAELDVYANLRPASQGGVDLVIVRELVGGLYFGTSGVREDGTVFDTCEYHPAQVERIARRAFALARSRRGRLTSVDKANVLEKIGRAHV